MKMKERLKTFIFVLIVTVLCASTVSILYSKKGLNYVEDKTNTDDLLYLQQLLQDELNENKADFLAPNKMANTNEIAASGSFTVNINSDLVTVKYPNATSFAYNTSASKTNAKYFNSYGGKSTTGTGYISLKNGDYYFLAFNTQYNISVATGTPYKVTGSCKNEVKTNQTGTYKIERCFTVNNKGIVEADGAGSSVGNCADGYEPTSYKTVSNDCASKSFSTGITKRYCKAYFEIVCTKKNSKPSTVPAAKLSSLSVSNGTLSPAFKSGTKKYSVKVPSNVSSIKINASAASGSTFVSGAGPRTVDLKYGSNSFSVKVRNSAGKVTTYTLNITREDGRSTVNTLSNLKVNTGTLSPAFVSNINDYTVDVESNVDSIIVDATLTDSSSKFVEGFGPATHGLQPGPNKIYIKVASQKGDTNIYSITVNRSAEPSECTTDTSSMALLKEIKLYTDVQGLEVPQLEGFNSNTFTYPLIKVDNQITNLLIEANTLDDADAGEEHVKITGNTDLVVGEPREISIEVTSAKCSNVVNTYTFNVERQEAYEKNGEAEVDITIANHDEFKFEKNVEEYDLTLNKGEDKLDITVTPLNNTICDEVLGNENLDQGSTITVTCYSEDEQDQSTYTIKITGKQKGMNVWLIVLFIIIIILLLIYVVMRLLGYRVYFNFSMLGSAFRGMNEKVNNMFDK